VAEALPLVSHTVQCCGVPDLEELVRPMSTHTVTRSLPGGLKQDGTTRRTKQLSTSSPGRQPGRWPHKSAVKGIDVVYRPASWQEPLVWWCLLFLHRLRDQAGHHGCLGRLCSQEVGFRAPCPRPPRTRFARGCNTPVRAKTHCCLSVTTAWLPPSVGVTAASGDRGGQKEAR